MFMFFLNLDGQRRGAESCLRKLEANLKYEALQIEPVFS
jgi:hypothetical protein